MITATVIFFAAIFSGMLLMAIVVWRLRVKKRDQGSNGR